MLHFMNERQQDILYQINEKGQVSVNDLSQLTGVSVVTIRQDLNFLEQHGYLKRTHGFAVAVDSDNVDSRMKINFALKQRLAEYAASFVENDERIFIEGGSSNALLARYLAYTKRITLITPSYYIAHLLKETDTDVIVLGGEYQKKSESVVGELTCSAIKQLNFDKAFIGIDGFHQPIGFAGRNQKRIEVVNTVLAKGVHNIIVTDSSKFGLIQPYPLISNAKIDQVITDKLIKERYLKQLQQSDINVDIVT